MSKLTCIQVHNDYQISGGETKTAKLIGDLLEEYGIKVIRYYKSNEVFFKAGLFQKIQVGVKALWNPDTIKEINDIVNTHKIDFVLIHNVSPIISNSVYKVLKSYNIPIIKYIQNYNLVCLNGALDLGDKCKKCVQSPVVGVCNACYKRSKVYTLIKAVNKMIFDKFYLNRISAFMPNSKFVCDTHVEYGLPAAKMHVMYNYIQGKTYYTEKAGGNHTRYLYFGRISREKGVFTVVNAFERLPNLELQIVGSGELENELVEKLKQNLCKNIQYLGPKYDNDLLKLVHDAKCVVVPSEWDEPLPRTILEAYYQGTPVIGTDKGGIPEMIFNGQTGYVYPGGDVDALIDRIVTLENLDTDSYIKMRKNCFSQHIKMYSKEKYMERFRECIEEIIHGA